MKDTSTPHDAYFKLIAASPAVAADIIRPLLDPAVASAIDWTTLERAPNEFTQKDGKATRADLVFKVRFKDREGFILILLEHQSTPDAMMPWRVLVYMVGIWRGWLEENPGAEYLPPIVPVVLYNGRASWNAPLDFTDLFRETPPAVLAALRPHLPSFRLLIDDLTLSDDDEIEADHQLALAVVGLIALKHAHGDPDETYVRLGRHIARARRLPGGSSLLDTTMAYLYRNAEQPPDPETLGERLDPEALEYLMGFMNRWREESRAEGQATLFLDALANKFGEVPDDIAARIRSADESVRRRWFSRIFDAKTIGDIFAAVDEPTQPVPPQS